MSPKLSPGTSMMRLAEALWPINRSLSGEGVRETLKILKDDIPSLEIKSIKSGERVFDWTVPMEWKVEEAYLTTPSGRRICDFMDSNLHLVGYSIPFEGEMSLDELQKHLYSLESQPDAIPYVTSYYNQVWGFCISQKNRDLLEPGIYKVFIKTKIFKGKLNYGELVIRGKSGREVFFSTYICHPSMANNELSGPVLAIHLAKQLLTQKHHYTYRFIFIPETIGSLIYMARHLEHMKINMLAGFVLTCVGDERAYSFLPSRYGNTVADRAALHVLQEHGFDFIRYSWLDRGSDERQYCSPGADLPVVSVMRSRYGKYPEYHTNLDKLGEVVTEAGLHGSFDVYIKIIQFLESRRFPRALQIGEPQLGRRNLYPNLSIKGGYGESRALLDAISIMDGKTEVAEIASILKMTPSNISKILSRLESEGLIEQ